MNASFQKLTPGKQKEYILYISEAKQEATRKNHLEKIKPMTKQGVGLLSISNHRSRTMATNKTKETEAGVLDFINTATDTDQKRKDSLELLKLMQTATGYEPRMWGPGIIGFGSYHYRYDSGHEGDAPLVGFSPRKAAISLYAFTGSEEHKHLLTDLGKFKMGKACIYVKTLSDINQHALKKLIKETVNFLKSKYEKH